VLSHYDEQVDQRFKALFIVTCKTYPSQLNLPIQPTKVEAENTSQGLALSFQRHRNWPVLAIRYLLKINGRLKQDWGSVT
jgi:hypothetical protein